MYSCVVRELKVQSCGLFCCIKRLPMVTCLPAHLHCHELSGAWLVVLCVVGLPAVC